MIKNITISELKKNKNLNSSFLAGKLESVDETCLYYKGNFFLDPYNYYPITEDFHTFDELFLRISKNSIAHYHTESFYENFQNKKDSFKTFNNCSVIGSNPGNNYFSNLIHFLPRIFFENEKEIQVIVHRSLSKKFKSFIEYLLSFRGVKCTFKYLDDDFYKFENCKIPQFLNTLSSIKLLRSVKDIVPKKDIKYDKIYIRREDSNYRSLLNEADLIEKLKKNGFKVINTSQYEILDQISFYVDAKVILSAYGSGLANSIFCNPGTMICEISPNINSIYDQHLSKRYQNLSKLCDLNYLKFHADSVNVDKHSDSAEKYINKKILNESNFYKNMILKLSEFDEIIKKTQQPIDE